MKRRLVLISVVVVLLVAAGAFGWQRLTASAAPSTRVESVAVTRGSLTATVSAAGNVSAPSTAALAFSSSGKIAQVAVRVGDQVKKGQLLMQLDTTDLELALKTAQVNLASQQASYDSTQATLQFAIQTAQANLASAQASYDSAQTQAATNLDQLLAAKTALNQARKTLAAAQGAYDSIAWKGDVSLTTQASTLQTAKADYESALATYNITAAGMNDTAIRSAQASVESAQVALDQAKKNLEFSTRTAKAALDNAKVAVEQAQRDLDNATLLAPFDGLVSAVNYSAGDTASGTAVSLVDLANLQVKLTIAEVDVAKTKVGQTAEMTLDALPGKTYQATLTAIGPVGTVTSGVVNYPVTVAVTNADASLKPGMTANLAIQVDRRENVLLIPTRAVRSQGNQKMVTVLSQGKTSQRPIVTGLTGDAMVEVTSGLQEGETVVVTQTTTTSSNNPGIGMGIGGPPGPPP